MGGRIPIERNLLRSAALLDRLLQELLGRGDIAVFTQEKVDGFPFFVDPTVEVDPFAFKLDVSFVDAPRRCRKRCG